MRSSGLKHMAVQPANFVKLIRNRKWIDNEFGERLIFVRLNFRTRESFAILVNRF